MRDVYDKRDVIEIVAALLVKLGGYAELSALEIAQAGDYGLRAMEYTDQKGMKMYRITLVKR